MNALKHGFYSKSPVIPAIEDQAQWDEHHAAMVASLRPQGRFEELLVTRLANIFWRIDRLNVQELASIMSNMNDTAEDMILAANYLSDKDGLILPDEDVVQEARYQRLLPNDLDAIIRYGAFLHRQWVQTLHELEALQARRLGGRTLPPVDIGSPPNMGPHRSNGATHAAPIEPT
jgi:hypothetical protein